MQRVSALWQASPQKLVSALFVLLLAAMMAVGSGASFTSRSANAGNVVAAGVMSISDSLNGGAILTVEGLVPGESDNGTVTITNSGDADGAFTLTKNNIVDSDGVNKLSQKVNLVVTDTTTNTQVYSGKLANMGARPAGTIAEGASHTYDFTVSFPDGGMPADATSGDNAYQGDDVHVDFEWESVSQ